MTWVVSFLILSEFGPRRCRELAGKLSRGDVTHETAKDLSDDDGYLHSDDEGITDLPLASSLVEHALDALVEQGEVKKSGDDYALVVDDDGDWFDSGVLANSRRRRRGCRGGLDGVTYTLTRSRRSRSTPSRRRRVDGVWRRPYAVAAAARESHAQVRRPGQPAAQVLTVLEAARIV